MTDGTAMAPLPVITDPVEPADSCEGEYCEIPAHREQLIINRRVDDDRI